MVLLQIPTDTTSVATGSNSTLSIIDLAIAGGWVMIPIALLSVAAIYLFVERILVIGKANQDPDPLMNRVKDMVLRGDINGAKMFCAQHDTPIARMIEKGIARIGSPLKTIEGSIENVAKIEIFKLEKNISTLATIAGVAPMIGFFGTVIGMVEAFMAIAQEEGSVSPKLLSSGIYTAMLTTVAGLLVGIIAYLGYNYLVTRVQKVIHRMEYTSVDFIDLLQEQK